MEKIIILGAGNYQKGPIQKLLQNYYVVAFDKNKDSACSRIVNEFFQVDISNKEAVLQVAKIVNPDAIMAINDFGVKSAAYASSKLGLKGISEIAAENSTNKAKMRQCWDAANLKQPNFHVIKDIKDLDLFQGEINYPFILKPADSGGGSRGVIKVNSSLELEEAYNFTKEGAMFSDLIIAEDFIDGTEITVEGFIENNIVQILAISDKNHYESDKYRVASSLNYPAKISYTVKEKVEICTEKATRALGINNCLFHIEMIVHEEEPYLVELGARPGGGHIFHPLVQTVSGIDYVQVYVDLLLGKPIEISNILQNGATYHFIKTKKGKVISISNIGNYANHTDLIDFFINLKVGDEIKEVNTDLSRAGFIVTRGKTREFAMNLAHIIEEQLKINIQE